MSAPHNKQQHLNYLDSARGIAALMVLFYHFINWRWDKYLGAQLASVIFNGSDAVSFFFVLSGFVLSYKYIVLKQPLEIKSFIVTRFFRLFPAFFVTVVLDALYWNRRDLHLHAFKELFITNKQEFWQEALLLRGHNKFYIPGWTLTIEMVISFFMPFMIVLAKQNRKLILWLIPVLFIIGDLIIKEFFIHFALGLLISCYFIDISDDSFKKSKWYHYKWLILFIGFILFSIRHIERIFPFGNTYNDFAGYIQLNDFHYTAIGSFIFLVAMVASKGAQKVLNHSVLRFYGRISYGVYLMHWEIVTAIFDHWDKLRALFPSTAYAFIVLLIACFVLTTVLAVLLHHIVELPFIRIGKRISKRMRPSVVIE